LSQGFFFASCHFSGTVSHHLFQEESIYIEAAFGVCSHDTKQCLNAAQWGKAFRRWYYILFGTLLCSLHNVFTKFATL